MNVVKSSPFSTRTKSLRERFGSKRSYSENFKDPPVPSSANQKDSAGRNVRPSMPNIGLPLPSTDTNTVVQSAMMQHIQEQQQQQQQLQQHLLQQRRHQVTVLSEHFNPFAALPEETYCSALDINSQQGDDPRFPWQRDAAVQCDMSPNGEGYRYARKDSFYMISRDAATKVQEENQSEVLTSTAPLPAPTHHPPLPHPAFDPTSYSSLSASADISGQSMAEKFREVYWPNLSICAEEEDETPPETKEKPKKKTTMLQRAMSERSRNRRLTSQMSLDECHPLTGQTSRAPNEGPSEWSPKTLFKEVSFSSAPTSRTETPPSDNSPQTPPSRRNSRKTKFVRKQTNSAPDSFDNDDAGTPPPHMQAPTILTHNPDTSGLTVGFFNFDSMQRLLDLSMSASAPPEKPTFLLPPGNPPKQS